MQIINDRRALHRIPELDKQLPKTMAYLANSLAALGCRVFSPMDGALCAYFDFGRESTIAFRSDADALPIPEQGKLDFASQHPGRMHACGHDGHMAILLELARRLDKKESLNHNILLIFQPAEETTGGARDICQTGIMKQYHVEAIFGLHIWPELAAGEIFSRRDEMLARSCEVKVDIYGKSAHIAKARDGIDAMAAGTEFYRKVCAMEGALPKKVFRLLKFGKFESGTVCNAISGHTHMEGSLRAFQDEVFYALRAGLVTIAKDIERGTGCTITVDMNDGYPAVMNPPEMVEKIQKIAPVKLMDAPSMTSEDFAEYQQLVPGVFFFLGTGDTASLHATTFNFDEEILLKGADFFEKLAENYQ